MVENEVNEKLYLEVKEIAKILKKEESTVRKIINKGELPALRKGAKNKISTSYALEYSEFMKDNKANIEKCIKKAKTICITNNKGGAAKTTTAVNLAALLNDIGNKVLLIDFDSQGNATQYSVEPIVNDEGVELPFKYTIKDILIEQKKVIK